MNTPNPSQRVSLATAGLWASAFVLAALVVVQAGRLASDRAWGPLGGAVARGDVVSRVGDYTTLTFNSGSDDVLAVLDGRGEQLFAYRIQNQNRLELLGVYDVKDLFAIGKRIGTGRR
ncbi:MAG: hypothetical protein KF869_00275 [Phycisphaeraceae bacterium]|nr:hypothetical protein [Phycisphaeraceae bacterium]